MNQVYRGKCIFILSFPVSKKNTEIILKLAFRIGFPKFIPDEKKKSKNYNYRVHRNGGGGCIA